MLNWSRALAASQTGQNQLCRNAKKGGRVMQAFVRLIMMIAAVFALATCGTKFRTYDGPTVTKVEIHKAERKMYLLSGAQVLKSYNIKLGGNPIGPKQFEGDRKTPEGAYLITHRNPRSAYHLSLGISYPNDADRAFASANGKQPGGDIFIHGANNRGSSRGDWTYGCIAVTDRQIEEIYAMVNPGTPINIFP
jgi:murein L,D-transpeptidase YafK